MARPQPGPARSLLANTISKCVFLSDGKSSDAIWQAFSNIWSSVYTGFPAMLKLDQESSFMSEKFQKNCEQQGISLSISGVETHNLIGAGERFHRHLRRVYNCIRRAHPSVDKEHVLRLSVKAVNDTVGPNGLVPSELVFGVRPTLVSDQPSRSHQKLTQLKASVSRLCRLPEMKWLKSRQSAESTTLCEGKFHPRPVV